MNLRIQTTEENRTMTTLNEKIADARALLLRVQSDFAPSTFANSLGAEDMVITHLIAELKTPLDMFMLDTGRLPEETYRLLDTVRRRYKLNVTVYAPNHRDVELYATEFGPNAFYDSVSKRTSCCDIRKVRPLRRALHGRKAWITGLRRQQSVTRTDLQIEEWDATFGLQKFNPLLEWSTDDVWEFIRTHDVPYNALHDQGYPSIGCAPCTRAVAPGEDLRAGRWWWENPDSKECGLHAHKS